MRSFLFLKREDSCGRDDFISAASALAASKPASVQTCLVNRVLPAIADLMPEPIWDAIVEYVHGAGVEPIHDLSALLSSMELAGAIDPDQHLLFTARAAAIIDGRARGIRILSFPRRRTGMTSEQFSYHYQYVHGALVARNAAFAQFANRYVQHHVFPESVSASPRFVPYDGISEFRFDSIDRARSAWDSPSYMEELRADELNFVGSPPSHRVMVEPVKPPGELARA